MLKYAWAGALKQRMFAAMIPNSAKPRRMSRRSILSPAETGVMGSADPGMFDMILMTVDSSKDLRKTENPLILHFRHPGNILLTLHISLCGGSKMNIKKIALALPVFAILSSASIFAQAPTPAPATPAQ